MKILIEIPDNAYEWINEHKGVTDFKTTEMLYNRVQNAIPLNGTNGDVIKAVFPNDSMNFLIVNMERNDWLNADYKGVE